MNKKVLVFVGLGISALAIAGPLVYMAYKKRMCDFGDSMYAFLTDDEKEEI